MPQHLGQWKSACKKTISERCAWFHLDGHKKSQRHCAKHQQRVWFCLDGYICAHLSILHRLGSQPRIWPRPWVFYSRATAQESIESEFEALGISEFHLPQNHAIQPSKKTGLTLEGEQHITLAVKWIWISTTQPQYAKIGKHVSQQQP